MIGSLPMVHLAPLDYRYALDAAMSVLGSKHAPLVICNAAEIAGEVRQRILSAPNPVLPDAGLWVEPLSSTWQQELATLAQKLPPGAPLVIIASRPIARWLPERRGWSRHGLGLRAGGVGQIRRALPKVGLRPRAIFGVHSGLSVVLSGAGGLVQRLGRPELGDRLHFAARLNYCVADPFSALATVALFFAQKEQGE
jgi:hypothetical protein